MNNKEIKQAEGRRLLREKLKAKKNPTKARPEYWIEMYPGGIPACDNLIETQKLMHEIIEQRKNLIDEEFDIYDQGMLDGMIVMEAAINGKPWPL